MHVVRKKRDRKKKRKTTRKSEMIFLGKKKGTQ